MIFPAERHRQIIDFLSSTGRVRVSDLAARFSVAEETIRRDLEKLDAEGKLMRTHGGAVALNEARLDPPFDIRATTHRRFKQSIAAEAALLIEPGDVIAMDASSTALEFARRLPAVPLTLITCSPVVPAMLAERQGLTVICTGGTLEPGAMCYVGWLAEHAIERFAIDKAFISCRGADLERGLSEAHETHARLKRRVIDLVPETVLLVDHSKLGVRSSVFYAGVGEVGHIITDDQADAGMIDSLRAAGSKVTVARSGAAG